MTVYNCPICKSHHLSTDPPCAQTVTLPSAADAASDPGRTVQVWPTVAIESIDVARDCQPVGPEGGPYVGLAAGETESFVVLRMVVRGEDRWFRVKVPDLMIEAIRDHLDASAPKDVPYGGLGMR